MSVAGGKPAHNHRAYW